LTRPYRRRAAAPIARVCRVLSAKAVAAAVRGASLVAMRRAVLLALAAPLAAATAAPAPAQTPPAAVYGDMSGASLGANASLNGAVPFPADNPWNTDISGAPVDPNSDALIAAIGVAAGLHPDFGSGYYDGAIIGIPYLVVGKGTALQKIKYTLYGDESDPGPFPIPRSAPIEGQTKNHSPFGGDRHVLVIDRDTNRLFELWDAHLAAKGWTAGSGAEFHLDSDDVRPTAQPGWTSADAAGLPIFPGLVRYDEVAAGQILHALRFTVAQTREAYVPPANHWASSDTNPDLPPMGMRVRLKASYVIPSSFSAATQVILRALQTYGMIVADNGSDWYISGAPSPNWNNDALVSELRQVTGGNFEVVQMTGMVTP
jgi:hypothetical protein